MALSFVNLTLRCGVCLDEYDMIHYSDDDSFEFRNKTTARDDNNDAIKDELSSRVPFVWLNVCRHSFCFRCISKLCHQPSEAKPKWWYTDHRVKCPVCRQHNDTFTTYVTNSHKIHRIELNMTHKRYNFVDLLDEFKFYFRDSIIQEDRPEEIEQHFIIPNLPFEFSVEERDPLELPPPMTSNTEPPPTEASTSESLVAAESLDTTLDGSEPRMYRDMRLRPKQRRPMYFQHRVGFVTTNTKRAKKNNAAAADDLSFPSSYKQRIRRLTNVRL